jgi:hypothetical protein
MIDWMALRERLFGGAKVTYALVDGASCPQLREQCFEQKVEPLCLYRGEQPPDMAQVAPYLIQIEKEGQFTEWLLRSGWGNHWAVFVESPADSDSLLRHLRNFTVVHDETGRPFLFRFYDPRVLRTYLPTCEPGELRKFFGPIERFQLEGGQPEELLCFQNAEGKLKDEKIPLPALAQ